MSPPNQIPEKPPSVSAITPATFLVCGIQKGGTTALHAYLASHPDVYCPARKELGFFDSNWERGLDWYAEQFAGAEEQRALGEASPHYMRSRSAAERIAQHAPDARLIFILRDPAQRAWSNYTYNQTRGEQDPKQSFKQALQTPAGRERYLDKGLYLEDLQRFAEVCGPERMLVVFAESLRQDPAATLDMVFRFIGVDPDQRPEVKIQSNPTVVPSSPLLQSGVHRWYRARRWLVPFVPASLGRATRSLRLAIRAGVIGTKAAPKLNDELRAELESKYKEPNQRLAAWLDSSSIRVGPRAAWLASEPAITQA
ncbi:MAG: hypothetical protein ACI8QC_000540 [Planctomycetota bacterium]|jgi:hypothetical protein